MVQGILGLAISAAYKILFRIVPPFGMLLPLGFAWDRDKQLISESNRSRQDSQRRQCQSGSCKFRFFMGIDRGSSVFKLPPEEGI